MKTTDIARSHNAVVCLRSCGVVVKVHRSIHTPSFSGSQSCLLLVPYLKLVFSKLRMAFFLGIIRKNYEKHDNIYGEINVCHFIVFHIILGNNHGTTFDLHT